MHRGFSGGLSWSMCSTALLLYMIIDSSGVLYCSIFVGTAFLESTISSAGAAVVCSLLGWL